MKVLQQLQDIFRDIFEDDSIVLTEETTAADIEAWDSLMHLSLTAAVEDAFSIRFTTDEIISMKNVGDFVTAIERKAGCG